MKGTRTAEEKTKKWAQGSMSLAAAVSMHHTRAIAECAVSVRLSYGKYLTGDQLRKYDAPDSLIADQKCGACHVKEESIRHVLMECQEWKLVRERKQTTEQIRNTVAYMKNKKMMTPTTNLFYNAILPPGHYADNPWLGVLTPASVHRISAGSIPRTRDRDYKGIVKLGRVCYDGACNIMKIYR
jgi:hypothetical protein